MTTVLFDGNMAEEVLIVAVSGYPELQVHLNKLECLGKVHLFQ